MLNQHHCSKPFCMRFVDRWREARRSWKWAQALTTIGTSALNKDGLGICLVCMQHCEMAWPKGFILQVSTVRLVLALAQRSSPYACFGLQFCVSGSHIQ